LTIAAATAGAAVVAAVAGRSAPARIVFRNDHPCRGNECGRAEIAVVNADGSGFRLLTHNSFDDSQPSWSPDRMRIAFVSVRGAVSHVFVMPADGSGVRRLTSGTGEAEPSWSPDGKRVVYRTTGVGGAFDLFTVPAAGGAPTRLTATAASELSPRFSPDGTRLAFSSNRSGQVQIWVLTLRTRKARQLTHGTASLMPAWSPDGRKLAFVRGGQIWTMNADGSGQRAIGSGTPLSAEHPSWSPDGRRIAFSRNGEVLVMNATGGGRRYVTKASTGVNLEPDW
jgi:Tol biopolymer transport system component